MTMKLQSPDRWDRLLARLGKERAVRMPTGTYKKFGPYVYAACQKESFVRALLRPKGRPAPAGYMYPSALRSIEDLT